MDGREKMERDGVEGELGKTSLILGPKGKCDQSLQMLILSTVWTSRELKVTKLLHKLIENLVYQHSSF